VIATGGGDDIVTYRGTETSIDAGSGVDTLVMAATGGTTAVNFSVAAGTDQTTGDSTSVANFENLNASALTTGINRHPARPRRTSSPRDPATIRSTAMAAATPSPPVRATTSSPIGGPRPRSTAAPATIRCR